MSIRGLMLMLDHGDKKAQNKLDINAVHASIQNQDDLGAATAILPLVSTLAFGFAVSELLGNSSLHPSVVILLTVSASTSLWVVTFSVLHAETSPLKLEASRNMLYMLVTSSVLHAETSPLKFVAP